jgi:serine/threonine protein kinase
MILDETDNITDNSYNSSIVVKLIDFGLGSKFTKGSKMGRACGTVYTAAPEILLFRSTVGYTEKADLWSIGVLTYMLLTHGQYPFLKDREELHDHMKRDKLENAEYTFPLEIHVSEEARTFVSNCLKRYPGARWSAIKALTFLQEEWIPSLQQQQSHTRTSSNNVDRKEISQLPTDSSPNAELQSIHDTTAATPAMGLKKRSRVRMETCMLNGISAYASTYGEFKKRVLLAMAYQMDKTSITKLRDLFFAIDTNNIGTLTVDELKGALNQMHADKHLSASTVRDLW